MIEDKKLIENYINGNRYSADLLIDKYQNLLYKLCNKISKSKDEAEDLFQESWLKIFKNIHKYNSSQTFENWIYTICINLYRDKYNKKKRWLNIVKDYFSNENKEVEINNSTHNITPLEDLLHKEDRSSIRASLNSMEDKYRIPLILYYFKDLSYKDIADILDIPVGTVKSRLNTSKNRLKSLLKEEFYG
ncbi:sigma-70 family RNA polymerase sigma factor [Clostridium sp. D2Q-11]|uniref:Sigma-70 family RNA polymerase sigma factor n=1 Tax=Anaeromonas frigoriresistens TaxID=2683708 RepID=A0A942Z8W5_9FIRM|nr:sigma-70 family RNA polymerase sigma factor [Anaeromonas frigoriresistens]MBS4538434.1 sigma-70 family RNA polymerase sigma factor [Anaeromonas frigoriresistens]